MAPVNPFQLPFSKAIEYFKTLVPLPSEKWTDITEQYRSVAWAIAGITKASILKDLQDAVTDALENGISPEKFREQFQDIMVRRGWSPGFSPYRISLIHSQAVRTAYSFGRWEQQEDPAFKQRHPYRIWHHRDSVVPRPHHLAQDGKVYPASSEVWKAIAPPPFGCRCTFYSLSQRQLEKEGLTVSKPPPLSVIAEKGFSTGFPASLEEQRSQLVADAITRLPPNLARLLKEDADFQEALDFYDPRQPRDKDGKFATKSGTLSKNESKSMQRLDEVPSSKALTSKSKKNRPSFDELVEQEYQDRLSRYKENGSYRYIMLKEGTYQQIEAKSGKDAAEKAFSDAMREMAIDGAIAQLIKMDIDEERAAITRSRNKQLKTELEAYDHLRPDLRHSSTLEEFKSSYPGEIEKLVERYKKEVLDDKKLSFQETMKRGQKLTRLLERQIKRAKTDSEQVEVMNRFRDDLLKSGLERQKAIALTDSIKFDKSIDIDKRSRPVTATSATEFYQITNGLGKQNLEKFELTDVRAYASQTSRSINIGSYVDKETIWHEMGHHVEFEDKRIATAARDWRDTRATGEQQKLNKLTDGFYRDDELALPDKYIHPYVGKVYSDGSTEVISMGLERFSSPEAMRDFYQQDREHFQFVLGVIRRD
jgi:SPP1 gp7 family putative phage head morphogenesis protein